MYKMRIKIVFYLDHRVAVRFDVHRTLPSRQYIFFLSYCHYFKSFDTKNNLLLNEKDIITRQEKRKVSWMMFLFFKDKYTF